MESTPAVSASDVEEKQSVSGTEAKAIARKAAWKATKWTADAATRWSASAAKLAAERLEHRTGEN
jgi:hypothetical protein